MFVWMLCPSCPPCVDVLTLSVMSSYCVTSSFAALGIIIAATDRMPNKKWGVGMGHDFQVI